MHRIHLFLALFALALFVAPLQAQRAGAKKSYATLEAVLNTDSVKPGQEAVVAIVLDVKKGYHAQSHTPLTDNLVKFEAEIKSNPPATASDPIYPDGKIETYGGEKLSVYSGQVITYIPIKISPDAKPGPLELKGTATYQICDNQGSCFFPETPDIKITTQVVAPDAKTNPNRPELFEGYKPQSKTQPPPPRGAPATQASRTSGGGPTAPPSDLAGDSAQSWSTAWAFAAAFLVGLIFNIMPCVLPVLPLKAIGFFEAAQHGRARSFALGVFFSIGVILFFAVLSLFLFVFKTVHLTWGQQFSNPYFVWGVVIVLLLMAAGLFGAFTLSLPVSVYNFTPRHDTYGGNVSYGLFTALLATPCSAPLLPPLLLWAASKPSTVAVLAMIMVGVGMAFPYLLLSALPEVARKFPRTGPWSELVKQMLGFLLLASAVYFGAGRLIHGPGFWWPVVAVVAVASLYLMGRTVQFSKNGAPLAFAAILAVILFGGIFYWAASANGLLTPSSPSASATRGQAIATGWVPYSKTAFDQARADNKIVLVKFTANWCVTCQLIEATVFADGDVWNSLRQHGVVTLKADMTNDPADAHALLIQLNPSGGIPLTAIYSPSWDRPLKLESQYTSSTLLRAIDAASAQDRVAASR